MADKQWYTAVLVFRSFIDGVIDYEPLTELQFRLIKASSSESAYLTALAIGEGENHSYKNSDSETVRWQFAGLYDLTELIDTDFHNGLEVYSQTLRTDPSKYVVPKDQLTVFWSERNKNRPATDILDNQR